MPVAGLPVQLSTAMFFDDKGKPIARWGRKAIPNFPSSNLIVKEVGAPMAASGKGP
jgi:hypothetical protein